MQIFSRALLPAFGVILAGCVHQQADLKTNAKFAPAYPATEMVEKVPDGAIFSGGTAIDFFSQGLSFRVGDVITVLLNESAQAARSQNTTASRDSSTDAIPSGALGKIRNASPFLDGISLSGAKTSSEGTGTAGQQASIKGAVAVTVVEVLANGNLVVRGEKQLQLSEGTEVIQLSGIVRPVDIARNNTVQSSRLANAQISYRGSGDLADANKAGWGTKLIWKLWPF